ncbi:MAG: cation:proton antiporter [Hyphomicrobiales bacterium]|nr:cation:proton antiporter [Hyphomicrobiales bacterium]
MPEHLILVTIGGLLLVGLAMDALGRQTHLPRVTLLVLVGIIVGPSVLDILPATHSLYSLAAAMALVMVAFLLGGKLTRQVLAADGVHILGVSTGVVLATALLVGGGLWVAGFDPVLSLALAGIATATDPAATQDVVDRSGARGPFSRLLLGVVAIDDAWGLIAFSLLIALAHSLLGESAMGSIESAAVEIGGAVVIGLLIGLPAAYLTGRLKPGEPTQAEALGVVFLCGGLALTIQASFLLAVMVAGFVIANLARHHARAFHEIEHIEWPFLVLFFVLAGASLDLSALPAIGLLGALYVVLRFAGRIVGGWLGAAATGVDRHQRLWIGSAMMPQAGVAMGMALIAAGSFPQFRTEILATTIAATVVFELGGPILTQIALNNVGETRKRRKKPPAAQSE